jgi:cystathionine beta-synthase
MQAPKGTRIVVLLADSVRNYMTKFLNEVRLRSHALERRKMSVILHTQTLPQDWMVDKRFMEPSTDESGEWWSTRLIGELSLTTPFTVHPEVSASECAAILQKHVI